MSIPELTLSDYKSLLARHPKPTSEQIEDFARFVSHAHSWYKHLPLFPPGVPFCFFLDPSAGMQQVVYANGVLQVVEREEKGFHYSWIPTKEYRTRFGYLAFSRSRGSSVSLVRADGARLIPSDNAAVVYDPKRAQLCALPEVLLHVGTTMVSGLVHTLAAGLLWRRSLDWTHLPDWPAESGGTETIQRIADRCRLLMADRSKEERLTFDEWSASKDARDVRIFT